MHSLQTAYQHLVYSEIFTRTAAIMAILLQILIWRRMKPSTWYHRLSAATILLLPGYLIVELSLFLKQEIVWTFESMEPIFVEPLFFAGFSVLVTSSIQAWWSKRWSGSPDNGLAWREIIPRIVLVNSVAVAASLTALFVGQSHPSLPHLIFPLGLLFFVLALDAGHSKDFALLLFAALLPSLVMKGMMIRRVGIVPGFFIGLVTLGVAMPSILASLRGFLPGPEQGGARKILVGAFLLIQLGWVVFFSVALAFS